MAGGRKLLGALAATVLLAPALLVPASTWANTIIPDTRADEPGIDPDNGNCTLREAIESADHDSSVDACRRGRGADVIKLRRGVYRLSVPGGEPVGSTEIDNRIGDLDIGLFGSSPLKILGHKRGTTIDGGDNDRVFQVFSAGVATFDRLTITNGASVNRGGGVSVHADAKARFVRTVVSQNTAGDGDGGVSVSLDASAKFTRARVRDNAVPPNKVGGGIGVFGRVELERTSVTGNDAGAGGGIWVHLELAPNPPGVAILRQSRVARNEAELSGGGIGLARNSRLSLTESTIERNDAGGAGGGISIERAALVAKASTIADNGADQNGGGISMSSDTGAPADLRLINSTVSGNVADQDGGGGGASEGGGISAASFGEKRIVSSTITANRADRGGGVAGPFVAGLTPVKLKGTIVAGNTALNATPANGPDCLFFGAESGRSLGHNLVGSSNGCDMDRRGSDIGGNAGLEPFARTADPRRPTRSDAARERSTRGRTTPLARISAE